MIGGRTISNGLVRCVHLAVAVLVAMLLSAGDAGAQHGKHGAGGKSKSSAQKPAKKSSKAPKASAQKKPSKKNNNTAKNQKGGKASKKERAVAKRGTRDRGDKADRRSGRRAAERRTARAPAPRPATPRPVTTRPRTEPARPTTQTRPAPPQPPAEDHGPADLAQQTLQGRGANTPARSKRNPPPAAPLSGDQLRAIDGARPETESISLRGYPEAERPQVGARPFHAEASMGLYATGALRAGYHGTTWPYDYALDVGFDGSNGHVDNASRRALTLGARGGYVIGSDYGIFSGGYMGLDADYRSENYRRYAVAAAPERTLSAWSALVDGRNSSGGFSFDLQGGYRHLSLTDSTSGTETSLDGSATARMEWSSLAMGGEAELKVTNLSGTSITYGRLRAYARYRLSPLTLRVGATFGVGANTDGTSASRLTPAVELNFYPLRGVTLAAGIDGGVTQNTLRGITGINPYVEPVPTVRHQVERIVYKGALRIEPAQSFGLHVSAAQSSFDDYLYFRSAGNGLFTPEYAAATATRITGDVYWEADQYNMIAAQATALDAKLDSSGRQAPYVPTLEGELMYVRRFADLPLSITGTLRYLAARHDNAGAEMIPVVLLGLKGRYTITKQIYATLELANLTNTSYELWPGYRERGVFAAVGLGASF